MENLKHSVPRKIVLIGASTGGPGQIQKVISSLPVLNNTSIVIGQHMVVGFLSSFASRLQKISDNTIQVVEDNDIFEPAKIYIARGKTKLNLDGYNLKFTQAIAKENEYNPDINILFNSFIPLCKDVDILTIILTGIGDDGITASQLLVENGSRFFTETSESAIVDGMPSRARLLVPNAQSCNMASIIKIIEEFCE